MTVDYESEVKSVQVLVSKVDQEYRVAAFQAILLHRLLGDESTIRVAPQKSVQKRISGEPVADAVSIFMNEKGLDTTEFSELFGAPKHLLEKSLAVLKIARDRLSVDGLSPADAAKILTLKFRVPKVHEPNVRAELRGATSFVSRIAAEHGYKYLLMAEGERHLSKTISQLHEKKS